MKARRILKVLILLLVVIVSAGCQKENQKEAKAKKIGEIRNWIAKSGWTSLHGAVADSNLDEIRSIINKGDVDINAQTSEINMNRTALHIAAMLGHKDIYDLLISEGANTEIEDFYGDTAPYLAEKVKEFAVIQLECQGLSFSFNVHVIHK